MARRTGRPTGRPPLDPNNRRIKKNYTLDPTIVVEIERIATEQFGGNASQAVEHLVISATGVQPVQWQRAEFAIDQRKVKVRREFIENFDRTGKLAK